MRFASRSLALLALLAGVSPLLAQDGFTLQDKPGEQLDILLDGKIAGRYMYAYDKSTPKSLNLTFKPYLHVFDAEGKAPITNGPGGQFPHHRGIYIGWNKISFEGKMYDRWHMTKGEIVHEKFLNQKADKDKATFTSLTHWYTDTGKVILDEERTMTIQRPKGPGRLVIDGSFKLTAPNGDVKLDGDPEHAGIHFRPAAEVVARETVYTFPVENAVPTKDIDYPWVGETFTLNGKRHSVVIVNHPDNPKNTRWSAYRDYGRFGAFPVVTIRKGESQTFNYRFIIADGEMLPAADIQKQADLFTGAKDPTPTPKTTVLGGPKKS
jgi:hypothetical protein